MRAKRYSAEQIVAKLREAEKLQAQGSTIPQSCKRLGISDQTLYRWRIKYGALKEDEAQRLKALEQEDSRLKKIVAEQALDVSMLKDLQRGNGEPDASARRGEVLAASAQGAGLSVVRETDAQTLLSAAEYVCQMADAHEARMALANWFVKILEELDEDFVDDPAAIENLKDRVAEVFAEWRIATGYGMGGPGTDPEAT
jgi:putative transposase